jgi:hypothetical protein
MKKIMINTDTLLDLLEKNEPDYRSVATILSKAVKLKLKVYFSVITLTKILEGLKGQKSPAESREVLRRIIQLGKVIAPGDKVFAKALNSSIKDPEFALQYYTADDHKMDYMITNQYIEKKNRKMPVLSADQFLNIIN